MEVTYNPTDPNAPEFTADELDSLRVGEEQSQGEERMLAGKYENAEQLEKAYLELQQMLGEKEGEAEEPEAEPDQDYDEEKPDERFTLFEDAKAQLQENGELSDEALDAFDGMSSRDLVDLYLEWQGDDAYSETEEVVDLSDQEVNQIKNSVGGEDAYNALMEWSSQSMPGEYVQAFDELVATGDPFAIQLAVNGLVASYQMENGFEGEMLTGGDSRVQQDVFRSQAELVEAMSDPRYDRDPAFRADIATKLERSGEFIY
jgi:hypothetical protein